MVVTLPCLSLHYPPLPSFLHSTQIVVYLPVNSALCDGQDQTPDGPKVSRRYSSNPYHPTSAPLKYTPTLQERGRSSKVAKSEQQSRRHRACGCTRTSTPTAPLSPSKSPSQSLSLKGYHDSAQANAHSGRFAGTRPPTSCSFESCLSRGLCGKSRQTTGSVR